MSPSTTIAKVEREVEREIEQIKEGDVDFNGTPARYMAFLARIRPIVQPLSRYLAYTSDLGESFRPIVSPTFVKATYGVSWIYLLGDVGNEGYKARLRAIEYKTDSQLQVVGLTVAKRAVFQATASMLFPALTIHSVVRYSAIALKKTTIKNVKVKTWAPTLLGLSVVPALPYLFDEPVEGVCDSVFDFIESKLVTDARARAALKSHPHEHEKKKEL